MKPLLAKNEKFPNINYDTKYLLACERSWPMLTSDTASQTEHRLMYRWSAGPSTGFIIGSMGSLVDSQQLQSFLQATLQTVLMLQNMMGMVLNRLRQLPEVPGKQMVHNKMVLKQFIRRISCHTEVPAYHIIHNRY